MKTSSKIFGSDNICTAKYNTNVASYAAAKRRNQKEKIEKFIDQELSNENFSEINETLIDFNIKEGDLEERTNRIDLCDLPTFTIDGTSCKDMDDAVSLETTSSGYRLGVHIADVASYVPKNSNLDLVACSRATSVYTPTKTINMLPSTLSEDKCSLMPNVKRKTISVLMKLDNNGSVKDVEICKGLIKSRVKGVYNEIDTILNGTATPLLLRKYDKLNHTLSLMKVIGEKLRKSRELKGAKFWNNSEPSISLYNNTISIHPTKRTESSKIIEEFMILANTEVSKYLTHHYLPCIYRAQSANKTKAAYKYKKMAHADLGLNEYCHFTSPIRRIADLKIHQILSYFLAGYSSEEIHEIFDADMNELCLTATQKGEAAKSVQERCKRFCLAQHLCSNPSKKYTGRIVGFNKYNSIIYLDKLKTTILGEINPEFKMYDRISFNVELNRNETNCFATNFTLAVDSYSDNNVHFA